MLDGVMTDIYFKELRGEIYGKILTIEILTNNQSLINALYHQNM